MQIPPEMQKTSADNMRDIFFKNVDTPPGAVVAGYWPIRAELDDLPVLRALLKRGHVCALPHVAGKGMPLQFRAWNETMPMVAGKYDIAEPAAGPALAPDMILVPVAAFDARRHRLGYGCGFYDRTLAHFKGIKPVLAIGIAYETQACDELPAEDNDVRMDMIITDRTVYR